MHTAFLQDGIIKSADSSFYDLFGISKGRHISEILDERQLKGVNSGKLNFYNYPCDMEFSLLKIDGGEILNLSEQNLSSIYTHFADIDGFGVLERDFSKLIARIDEIQAEGHDIVHYLYDQFEEVDKLYSLIKITRINDEILNIYESDDKDVVIQHISSKRRMNLKDFIAALNKRIIGQPLESNVELKIKSVKGTDKVVILRSRIYNPKTKVDITVNNY